MINQILKVKTDTLVTDDGPDYNAHYILYEQTGDPKEPQFAIYCGDGKGDAGTLVALGDRVAPMRSMVMRLGEFVEYGRPVTEEDVPS